MKKESKLEDKPQSTMQSADDLIVKVEQEKLGKIMPEVPVPKIESKEEIKEKKEVLEAEQSEESESKTSQEETKAENLDSDSEIEEEEKSTEESETEESESESSENTAQDNQIDEYGNKIGKKKLYTDEDVQKLIQKRLKNLKESEQQQQQQQNIQQTAKDFTPDPESEESWETQLEGFIEKTIEKRAAKEHQTQWQKREEQSMAEFEVKFSEGMGKYKDFNSVVGGKPITNAMMMATRGMKDPAAFLYAACKQQPKELSRIAEMSDSMAQAAEIGRLEERMKKARVIPSSPKPASRISGDASSEMPQVSIDARIAQHAKTKVK